MKITQLRRDVIVFSCTSDESCRRILYTLVYICMPMTPSFTSLSLLRILLYLSKHHHFHWHSLLDELEQTAFRSIRNWISSYWHKSTTHVFWSNKLIFQQWCHPSRSARNLGFIFNSDTSFSDQINSVSKSCHFHIRDIRRIRHLHPLSTATAIITKILPRLSCTLHNQVLLLQIHLSLANSTTTIHYSPAYLTSKSQKTSTHSKFIGMCHYKHFKISTHHTNTQKTTNRLQTLSSHIQNTYKSTTVV